MARRTIGRGTAVADSDELEKGDDGMPVSRRNAEGGFSRSARNSGDEEETKRERGSSTAIGKGWGAASQTVKSGNYKNSWKPEKGINLIKFLEDSPFSVIREHWFDRKEKEGKLAYICLGDDCPLCDSGMEWTGAALFNILVIKDADDPIVTFWKTSGRMFEEIKTFAENDTTKPINRTDLYFEVKRTGEGLQTRYALSRIRARDVQEEYKFDPYTDEEIAEFSKELVTEEEAFFVDSKETLKEVLNSLN